jgi:hypothetical protein
VGPKQDSSFAQIHGNEKQGKITANRKSGKPLQICVRLTVVKYLVDDDRQAKCTIWGNIIELVSTAGEVHWP